MDLRKHFRYIESFPHTQFVDRVSPQLQTLHRYQCQGCGRLNHNEHHLGAAGEHPDFTEESAFKEASRRAASQRASFDQKAGWPTVAPAAWNCGVLAPEWPRPESTKQTIPQWVENGSDYGTWSDSEPKIIVYPRGKSLVMLPPPKCCTQFDLEGAPTASEYTMRPSEQPKAAYWYPYTPTIKEDYARYNNNLRRRPNNRQKTTPLFPNQKLSLSENTTADVHFEHPCNTGPSTARTWRKYQSTEETTSEGEARVRRPPSRPRRPHSAAPRTLQPNNGSSTETSMRKVKKSASAVTVHSDEVARSQSRSSAIRKNTLRRLSEKIRNRAEPSKEKLKPEILPAGKPEDEREMKSWSGEGTVEESERVRRPTPSSGDRTYRREEKPKAPDQVSSQEKTPRTPKRKTPRPPTKDRRHSSRGHSGPEQEPSEKPSTDQCVARAEKVGTAAACTNPEQEKSPKYEAVEKAKLVVRPTILDGRDSKSEESISPFLSRILGPFGMETVLPPGGSKDAQYEKPAAPEDTQVNAKPAAGDSCEPLQNSTVSPVAARVNAITPKSTAPSTGEAVVGVDFDKCVDLILNSTPRVNAQNNPHEENCSGGQVKNDFQGINQLTAEVTEQILRAPDARGKPNHSPESTRDLTAVNSSLSTTLSSEATASTGNSSKRTKERKRGCSISKGKNRSSASIHSHREIASVVNEQLKQVRIGVGQLEKLIKVQRLLEEEISEFKTQNQQK